MKKITQTLLLLLTLSGTAYAADFSFTGTLASDDEVQLFNITIPTSSTVTFLTWSYAGGTNSDGTVIPAGGFDPILSVFDSAGNPIQDNDDGNSSNVPADPVTGKYYDTYLTLTLAPGNYTVAVSQYDNRHGATLSDPFSGSGTSGFVDVTGATRTGSWAFDALNVGNVVAPTPVPVNPTVPVAAPLSVPTLPQWALILLSFLLFATGIKSRRQN